MPGEAHVLVGCGGSGIRTLRRLNELLSQDYYWRRRIDDDIYYLIVDTDIDEMAHFEKDVRRDLQGVPDLPFVTKVQLSHGETHLQPLVYRHMVEPFAGGDAPGRQRLLEHWWNRGPDDPFIAPSVMPLTEGAGQCPPVSYFLTWKNLRALEDSFNRLIREIQRRKGGFGRYDELNFLIVAGLAGGTGRGSWELVAFKLRELFLKQGNPPSPRAFLFDSTIFRDVFIQYPEQKTPMQANALTGMSQLACWTSNRRAGHTNRKSIFAYQLPDLDSPANPSVDVLSVDLEVDVNTAAPVNHAYLIFDQNEVAHLADHFQYYEMVGAGIYAALSKSSILRQAINSGFPYVGLATATYEVNAATLRRYFEAQSRYQAVRMLGGVDERAADEKVREFFQKTQLRVDVTDDDPVTYFQADPKGLFLQRVIDELQKKSQNRLRALESALEADDVEETIRLARGLAQKNESLVDECMEAVISQMKLDPAAAAQSLARELFEHSKSAANVKLFVEKVQAGLEEEWTEMPSEMPFGREDPAELAERFSSRPIPVFVRHFNTSECKALMDACRRAIPKANYPVLREKIETAYKTWSRDINRLRENADDLLRCLQRLEQKYEKQREATVPDSGDAFGALFTDPLWPEKGLDQRWSAKKFYRRDLRPVLKRGEDLKLLEGQVALARELFTAAFEAVSQPRDFSEAEAFDVRKRLERRLDEAIRETVGLEDRFISDHFSIRKVIGNLLTAWKGRLRKKLSWDERGHLEERFQEFFGFRPKQNPDEQDVEYEFPELEDFILHMAASLSRTCQPYWKLERKHGKDFRVAVFTPTEKDREEARTAVLQQLGDPSIQVEIYPESQSPDVTGETTANPFIMLAYSTQGVDELAHVESLGYYNEPRLLETLKETESETGQTIFEGGRNGGIGYTDPLYVRNETIRNMRWRPWYAEDALSRLTERQTLDALLYALFPGDADESETLKNLQNQLNELGWETPLIVNKGKNRFVFTRLPLEFVDEKVQTDQQTQNLAGWDKNKPVAPSAGLHNVYQAIDGEKGSTAWRDRMLRESETFWGPVLRQLNIAGGMPAYQKILEEYTNWLGKMSRSGDPEDASTTVWNGLLGRIKEFTQEAKS